MLNSNEVCDGLQTEKTENNVEPNLLPVQGMLQQLYTLCVSLLQKVPQIVFGKPLQPHGQIPQGTKHTSFFFLKSEKLTKFT